MLVNLKSLGEHSLHCWRAAATIYLLSPASAEQGVIVIENINNAYSVNLLSFIFPNQEALCWVCHTKIILSDHVDLIVKTVIGFRVEYDKQ